MTNSRVALLALLLAPVAAYAVVVPSEGPPPTAFFPTAVGTKWVYNQERTRLGLPEGRGRPWRDVEIVSTVFGTGDERFVTVRDSEGSGLYPLTEWHISRTGIRHRGVPDPSETRSRYPSTPGAWVPGLVTRTAPGTTWVHIDRESRERSAHTVVGWEAVHVPAGTFRTLRIDTVVTEDEVRARKVPLKITASTWYARDVGLVKLVARIESVSWMLKEELTFFAPGAP